MEMWDSLLALFRGLFHNGHVGMPLPAQHSFPKKSRTLAHELGADAAQCGSGMGCSRWLGIYGRHFCGRTTDWAAALGVSAFLVRRPASILVLDFALYVQHRLFHSFPLLWRVHQVHHADLGVDATTGLRFHPIEIFLSLAYKAVVIIALGAPAWAAVAFEILLNATSVFNHSNVSLPERLDQGLRWFLVTPDMHRIHHSTRAEETHANFGFSVPWWDRLCRTYRAEPALGQLGLEIGLSWYRASFSLGQVLLLPFQTSPPLEKTWKEVSPLHLREMLAEENPPYVLDVRDLGEFTGELGHIAGAHLLPVSDLDKRLNELALGRSRPVVLV